MISRFHPVNLPAVGHMTEESHNECPDSACLPDSKEEFLRFQNPKRWLDRGLAPGVDLLTLLGAQLGTHGSRVRMLIGLLDSWVIHLNKGRIRWRANWFPLISVFVLTHRGACLQCGGADQCNN